VAFAADPSESLDGSKVRRFIPASNTGEWLLGIGPQKLEFGTLVVLLVGLLALPLTIG
jgi:hypothetical protein